MSLETVLRDVKQLSEEEKQAVLEVLQGHFFSEYASLSKKELGTVQSRLAQYRVLIEK